MPTQREACSANSFESNQKKARQKYRAFLSYFLHPQNLRMIAVAKDYLPIFAIKSAVREL